MPFIDEAFHTNWCSLWSSEVALTRALQESLNNTALRRSLNYCSDKQREHLHHLMRYRKHQQEI